MSLLALAFLGFFALIIIFQLVPAAIMFFGTMKGLFFYKGEVKQ